MRNAAVGVRDEEGWPIRQQEAVRSSKAAPCAVRAERQHLQLFEEKQGVQKSERRIERARSGRPGRSIICL